MGPVSDTNRSESPAASLDDVVDVLRAGTAFDLTGASGPHHDLLDHSLQTAHVLRRSHPADIELQVAGLVHDIGHTLPPRRDEVHAEVAAAFVRPVLGPRVARLVGLHVAAKRYLVTTHPDYRRALDEASITSLEVQGGEMSSPEVREFESDALRADALALRRADDAGKIPGLAVPGLGMWLATLRSQDFRVTRRYQREQSGAES